MVTATPHESFPLAARQATLFVRRDTTGSTNADLLAEAHRSRDFTVIVSTGQTAGRGRLDRTFTAPPGTMLAASVLVRPRLPNGDPLPVDAWGWFPLLSGTALRRTLEDLLPDAAIALKWPNDVQIGGLKVSGILAEIVASDGLPDAVVIGSGVNLTIPADALPTPTSTSLSLEGMTGTAAEIGDRVLAGYLGRLRRLVDRLCASGGDVVTSGLFDEAQAACSTIGQRVRVELPDGTTRYGIAVALDTLGRLVVEGADEEGALAVSAGDVSHLRYE